MVVKFSLKVDNDFINCRIHEFYLKQGFDVLKVQITPQMQLWPITIKPVVANVSLPNKFLDFYCPSTKLSEGTVSGGVCLSMLGTRSLLGGGWYLWYQVPSGRGMCKGMGMSVGWVYPAGPWLLTHNGGHHTYGCQADGMHPTGMLSRVLSVHSSKGKSANHSDRNWRLNF